MLAASLEERFRHALGKTEAEDRRESIGFAVSFAQLAVRVVPGSLDAPTLRALADALRARTELSDDEIELLLRLADAPEHRAEVAADEVAAFAARFGPAAANALRATLQEEVDLEAFADRYGEAEALLLLDALFAVCAVDGEIDSGEIDRLQDAARRLQVDPTLTGLLYRKHDLRHAEGDTTVGIRSQDRVVIGRSPGCLVRLPDAQVAPRHAELRRTAEGWTLHDLGSGRPTLLRGSPVASAPLVPGDEVRVGPYRLALRADGDALSIFGADTLSALSVRGVSRRIPTPQGPITLLDDVGFTVFSGEVIALVGPSGAGKTTLLHAIAGIAPPDEGHITLDGGDFHTMLASDRSLVGIVPQDDIVHGELSVQEALRYAGRLRFPSDVDAEGVDEAVDRVLQELGLEPIRDRRIGTALERGISGGQRKRVSLGQELLTRTTRILFLDEPTSGLDPRTAQDIVTLARQLADDGRIVFLVTHDVSPSLMTMVDHLLVLAPGGRLAWFGPPDEACKTFDVGTVDGIFGRLPDRAPEVWQRTYREGAAWRKYVRTREHLLGLDALEPPGATRPRAKRDLLTQYLTLTRRYALVKVRDWTGTGVLLAQAPILAAAFAIVFPAAEVATLFVLILSALWFGASASVRELIAERPIWRRESRVGLRLAPYVASKVTVLAGLVAVQCAMLTGLLHAALGFGELGFSLVGLTGVTVATGLVGMSMGLAISATFSSSEAAVGALPLVLIPQIAFGGLLVKVKEMTTLAKIFASLTITRYGFEAAIKTGEQLSKPGQRGLGPTNQHVKGFLYELGFRTSGADDMGIPIGGLAAIAAAFFVVFLIAALVGTDRARRAG